MAKQINVSFKETDIELKLYNWLKGKLSPSNYIKETMYQAYLVELGELAKSTVTYASQAEEVSSNELEETNVDLGEYDID